jgi:hypothetical protein
MTVTFQLTYQNNCTSLADWQRIGDGTYSNGGNSPFQSPRLQSNTQVVTGVSGATSGACIAVYSRADSSGRYPFNWANGAVQMHQPGSHYTEARYEFRCKYTGGTNTKGVYLLWPDSNHWSSCPDNSAVEQDMVEWYGTTNHAGSNLHYKTTVTSTKFQDQLGLNGGLKIGGVAIDWSVWHVVVFDNTVDYITMTVDGSVVDGYPITRKRNLPQTSFFFGLQTAMIGASRDVSHTTCTAYLDYLKVSKRTGGTVVTGPSAPQGVAVPNPLSASAVVNWRASTPGSFPIAGYNVLAGPHSGTLVKQNSTPVSATSFNITGLTANTSYDVFVRALDSESTPKTADSATVTFSTQAGTVVGPTSNDFAVSPGSCFVGDTITAGGTLATGSVTASSIDWGDGTAQWTGTTMPTGQTHQYAASSTDQPDGVFYVTLNLTDGTNPFTVSVPVTVGDQAPNTQLTLPAQGDPLDTMWRTYNAAFSQVQNGAVGNTLPAQAFWLDDDTGGLGWGLAGDDYYRTVLSPESLWMGGDGTWDVTTAPPLLGAGAAIQVQQPAGAAGLGQFFDGNSNNSGTAASTTASVVFPDNIPDGSYALLGVEIRNTTAPTTPSGWTLVQIEDDTGTANNNQLALYGKAVGSADSSSTQNITIPSSLWATAVDVYSGCSGVAASAGQLNAQTAQTTHQLPSVTTTADNQIVVGISGCRFTSNSTTDRIHAASTGVFEREADASVATSGNNVSLTMFDYVETTSGTVSTPPPATTGRGAFSTGITVALTTTAGSGAAQADLQINGVVGLGDSTAPAANPTSGTLLYGAGGRLYGRAADGYRYTVATVETLTFRLSGSLTTGLYPIRIPITYACEIESVAVTLNTTPSGSSAIIDLQYASTYAGTPATLYTTSGNRPTITAGSKGVTAALPDITTLTANSFLQPNVAQIGSGSSGADGLMLVRVRRTG